MVLPHTCLLGHPDWHFKGEGTGYTSLGGGSRMVCLPSGRRARFSCARQGDLVSLSRRVFMGPLRLLSQAFSSLIIPTKALPP